MQSAYLKKYDNWLFYSLIALLIWLPIPLGSNREFAWGIAQIWISLQAVITIILYRNHLPTKRFSQYKALIWGLVFFQVWVALQIVPIPLQWLEWISPDSAEIYTLVDSQYGYISLDRQMTLAALAKGIAYCLFLFNTIVVVSTSRRLKYACVALVISGTFQALYGAFTILLKLETSTVFNVPVGDVATGSFIYQNHYANYLLMTICIGIGLVITQLHTSESGTWAVRIDRLLTSILSPKMFIRLCLIFMTIALVMSHSRMGNAAFFCATTIGGVLALCLYQRRPRALTALIVSIIAIDLVIIGALFGLGEVQQRIAETSWLAESRDQVYSWSLGIIQNFPFTGTGMASFYTVFPGYEQSYLGFYDFAHSEYIQFAAEAGLPATVLLGSVVLYSLAKCAVTLHRRHSRTMKGIALGALMAIIGMLIHIGTDFGLQPMANAITFIFVLFLANATAVVPAKTVEPELILPHEPATPAKSL
ncbi:O-antigen ligase family protein [Vibrio sp. SM6]|uniref:O-antigen ligase family protein n=1 Tax=Vibrio agarilyticus TaxID=2726741 RepID=A0A7X8YGF0_9VIBR|nr:O-antigen ligase family protein [Vibrio agarilyticus]NLS12475.1 O-antigen ligase family protein [Vibrio agarilyticus]